VCWGNCKVFAKKIPPPDKKINYKCQEVEIFFAKLCTNLARGVGCLILFKVLLLSSISFIHYLFKGVD
jgi:hypothetical protein